MKDTNEDDSQYEWNKSFDPERIKRSFVQKFLRSKMEFEIAMGTFRVAFPVLLDDVENDEPEIFWTCFQMGWNACDNTWDLQERVLRILKAQLLKAHFEGFISPAELEFYNSLPPIVTIYRGCLLSRQLGISWTTDPVVAKEFAVDLQIQGFGRAAVYRAQISREKILTVSVSRGENEVLIDPHSLSNIEPIRNWVKVL